MLLVIGHGVKLNGDAYKKLEAAGYTIIRGDPSQFVVLDERSVGQPGGLTAVELLECARAAIAESTWEDPRERFSRKVLKLLLSKYDGASTATAARPNPERDKSGGTPTLVADRA